MPTTRAIVGGGCFWCTEAVFRALRGVQQVICGYAGGQRPNPSYEYICTGVSGHAEVVAIDFDPTMLSYADILHIFFATHDPTTLNRQGHDIGSQYRSVIFYLDDHQHQQAEQIISNLQQQGLAIVTECSPAPTFYPAEEYHQDYFTKNPNQGYCNALIPPKLLKLRHLFSNHVK
jgi:peptide-methionine (S)-S-oxide reductase